MAINLAQLITKLKDTDLVEFISDTIDYLKGERVPFLTKYGQTIGYSEVISVRDFIIAVMQISVRKSPLTQTYENLKEVIKGYLIDQDIQLDNKYQEILSSSTFARREELRQVLTQLVFQETVDKHLVDYNYNIELCLASDTFSKVNEPILVLELFLKASDGKKLEKVVIEMNTDEAKAFVSKLREIERELIGTSE